MTRDTLIGDPVCWPYIFVTIMDAQKAGILPRGRNGLDFLKLSSSSRGIGRTVPKHHSHRVNTWCTTGEPAWDLAARPEAVGRNRYFNPVIAQVKSDPQTRGQWAEALTIGHR